MKFTPILILCVLVTSFIAVANPRQLFLDLPIAESIGAPGLTAYRLDLSLFGAPSLAIGRSIAERLDVWMISSPSDLFSLYVKALLVDRLGPLSLSLTLSGSDGLTLLSALYLGPVQVDWGATFCSDRRRWATVTASPNQWYSLLFGVQYDDTGYSTIAAVRVFPRRGVWGFSIYYRGGEWGASLGGVL